MQRETSPKLEAVIAMSYRDLHQKQMFARKENFPYEELFISYLGGDGKHVFDFGCGPEGGLMTILPHAEGYDPYVPRYATPTLRERHDRYDAIYSADVLEHLTLQATDEFLAWTAARIPELVFLVISTRAAESKQLNNGMNVHVNVMPAGWWFGYVQAKLGPAYSPTLAFGDMLADEAVLVFRRRQ